MKQKKNYHNSKSPKYTKDDRKPRGGHTSDPATKSTHNDPSWYVENPQLIKDVANLAFPQALGLKTGLITNGQAGSYANTSSDIPGICTLELEPSLGCGKEATDAATIAARRIYTFVRHANSGSANYEAPDLMMMILAYSSIQAWLASMRRAYGLASGYYTKNRYYARAMITACGFNPDHIMNNLADFRAHINLTAARLNSIKIPAGLTLTKRWVWLCSNVFTDDDALKAQTYVPRFMRFLKYDGYKSQTGTSLAFAQAPDEYAESLQDVYNFTESLMSPLMSEEDVGIMSGDIMKAYGNNVSVETMIAEDYTTLPAYDKDVLMQIHNAHIVPGANTRVGRVHTIIQEGGVIKETFTCTQPSGLSVVLRNGQRYYLDVYSDSPTPEMVMVATRFQPVYGPTTPNNTGINEISSCGTEILLNMYLYKSPDAVVTVEDSITTQFKTDGTAGNVENLTMFSMFNWHPILYVFDSDGRFINVLGDFENYTTLDFSRLAAMNKVAVLAEVSPR